jgi:hypothetical protein
MKSPTEQKPKDSQAGVAMPLDVEIAAWNTLLDEGENWTAEETKAYVAATRVQREIRRRKRS